jgi:hypothetical protein
MLEEVCMSATRGRGYGRAERVFVAKASESSVLIDPAEMVDWGSLGLEGDSQEWFDDDEALALANGLASLE